MIALQRITWSLSERTRNRLRRHLCPYPLPCWDNDQIDRWLSQASDSDILQVRHIGPAALDEIREAQRGALPEDCVTPADDDWLEHAVMVTGQTT